MSGDDVIRTVKDGGPSAIGQPYYPSDFTMIERLSNWFARSNYVKYSSARRLGGPNWLDRPRGFCNSPHMLCIVQL
jgi:hypothetical protein